MLRLLQHLVYLLYYYHFVRQQIVFRRHRQYHYHLND
jgi:hypothetical protein